MTGLRHQQRQPVTPAELADRLELIATGLSVWGGRLSPSSRAHLNGFAAEIRTFAGAASAMNTRRRNITAKPAARTTPDGLRPGAKKQWLAKNDPATGTRLCAGCEEWLPFDAYDHKTPDEPTLRSHCRDCWKEYQRHRYVAANKRALIVEVVDDDEIVGAICNGCGRPFQIGDKVVGVKLRHEGCLSKSDTRSTAVQPTAARGNAPGRSAGRGSTRRSVAGALGEASSLPWVCHCGEGFATRHEISSHRLGFSSVERARAHWVATQPKGAA